MGNPEIVMIPIAPAYGSDGQVVCEDLSGADFRKCKFYDSSYDTCTFSPKIDTTYTDGVWAPAPHDAHLCPIIKALEAK